MRRGAGVRGAGALAALLGIAAIPAVSYAGGGKNVRLLCAAKRASDCGTLVIRVYGVVELEEPEEPERPPRRILDDGGPLRIAKLGSGPRCETALPRCWGKVLRSMQTGRYTLRVSPGRFGIAALEAAEPGGDWSYPGAPVYTAKEVTVDAGQTVEATLQIDDS